MTAVTITRVFAAPIDRVWAAFTDPDVLAGWFWPSKLQTSVKADVRVGGQFRIESASAEMAISGQYQEVTPPHRLVMTWRWDGDDVESLVTIELARVEPATGDSGTDDSGTDDSGTEVRLRHERLVDDHDRVQHEQGWNDCLDRLIVRLR